MNLGLNLDSVLEEVGRILNPTPRPSATPPLVSCAVGVHERSYQRVGIDWLYQNRRGMLTDAPGLGKTPQGALASVPPVLVVAPNYLVGQWGAWLEEHLPSQRTVVARGDRWAKMKVLEPMYVRDDLPDPAPDAIPDFLVVNKEMLRTHLPQLRWVAPSFNTLLIDEAHHMRNSRTEQSKGALELARMIDRVYLLTASPIWREVDDLFGLFRLIHPEHFRSYNQFVKTWCVADESMFGVRVTGVKKEMRAELEQLLDIMRLGRSYKDAGRELPPTIDSPIVIDFDDTMRKHYDQAIAEYRLQYAGEGGEDLLLMSNSAVMHTLRQLTGYHGKVETVIELLEEAYPYTQGRAVVFCWYRDMAEALATALRAKKYNVVEITGAMQPAERVRLAKGDAIVVATIPALSEGVDLSWARHVIFAEQNWTPGSALQSLARVVRERQTATDSAKDVAAANAEPVLVHYVQVRKTIDEVIYKTSRRRSATMKDLLRETLDL